MLIMSEEKGNFAKFKTYKVHDRESSPRTDGSESPGVELQSSTIPNSNGLSSEEVSTARVSSPLVSPNSNRRTADKMNKIPAAGGELGFKTLSMYVQFHKSYITNLTGGSSKIISPLASPSRVRRIDKIGGSFSESTPNFY